MILISEAQGFTNDMVARMIGKGLISPDASVSIRANAVPYLHFSWKKRPGGDYDYTNNEYYVITVDGEDILGAFDKAREWVTALPDKSTRERDQFLAMLAEVTEYGSRIGIDDGFVNPLRVMAQKLSENALEAPKE